MDQQLPQILLLSGRSPDPRKPPFHQQFQNQRRVAPVVFLGAHLTGANLRCISDPHVVPLCRGHFHKPLTVPGGLHPDKSRGAHLPIKPLGFSRPMLQLLFSRLSSDRVQPTNLLPTGVVITSNKDHRRLLSTELLRSSNQKHTRPPIGAFALIQSIPVGFMGRGLASLAYSEREVSGPGPLEQTGPWLWHIRKRIAGYPDIARSIRGTIFAPGHPVFRGARRGQG